MNQVLLILTTAIVGFLASAAGAWLAIHFNLRQFRGERAFERQLDWYERTTKALIPLQFTLGDIIRYRQHDPSADVDSLFEALPILENRLLVCLAEAEVYAASVSRGRRAVY